MEALFNDDEDEEDENSFSIGKVLASTGFAKDQDGNLTFGAGKEEARPDSTLSGASMKETRVIREVVKEKVRLQPAFQPGTLPLCPGHSQPACLCLRPFQVLHTCNTCILSTPTTPCSSLTPSLACERSTMEQEAASPAIQAKLVSQVLS